jgi:hypothetical protein
MPIKPEPELKRDLVELLADDFEITPEAEGCWPLDGSKCFLDFLLRPKPHIIEKGFRAKAFGVEVKSPISPESVKKLLDCVFQSYTYTLCEFCGVRPDFVLIYPEAKHFFEYDFEKKYKSNERNKYHAEEIRMIRRIMQRANVGELVTSDKHRYEIQFAASRYFDPVRGQTSIEGLGTTRRVGSRKL